MRHHSLGYVLPAKGYQITKVSLAQKGLIIHHHLILTLREKICASRLVEERMKKKEKTQTCIKLIMQQILQREKYRLEQ